MKAALAALWLLLLRLTLLGLGVVFFVGVALPLLVLGVIVFIGAAIAKNYVDARDAGGRS